MLSVCGFTSSNTAFVKNRNVADFGMEKHVIQWIGVSGECLSNSFYFVFAFSDPTLLKIQTLVMSCLNYCSDLLTG
ncbi:hypothetical protein EXN66_Car000087 [Channa argus]|uniref:Uncharacterized protein n=1 Tax=Channa argus TaxID=215402 RepID=A0A6G1QXW9_CHAAH|nr:hypothetical protein EXN66_Car000087 [Channa argus]